MPWRGHNGGFCHICGRPVEECGQLSARYRCAECGDGRMLDNAQQLRAHAGPAFVHWRRRCLAAFGVPLLDDRADES